MEARNMIGRFREKQYQLAAQRQNEAYLKHDYHQRTAKYFERECVIAKHYDSWNTKSLDHNASLEKAKKGEELLLRRNKLRNLLKEEQEQYERELEALKFERRHEPASSLEELKERLKQNRVERNLHVPPPSQRYRLHVLSQNSSQSAEGSVSSKYSARYARRSLENTNVRCDTHSDYMPTRSRRSIPTPVSNISDIISSANDNKENLQISDRSGNDDQRSRSSNRRDYLPNPDTYLSTFRTSKTNVTPRDDVDGSRCSQSVISSTRTGNEVVDQEIGSNYENDMEKTCLRMANENGVDQTLSCGGASSTKKNLCERMILYINHIELTRKIEDLARRELQAFNKRCWNEALRLRNMKNRLELSREKRLFNDDCLEVDEETKKLGLLNIKKREDELADREYTCMDTTIYSDGARALWQTWVREDEKSVIKELRVLREALTKELENEWQNLAIREKKRFVELYRNVINGFTLSDERRFVAKFTAAQKTSIDSI